MYDNIQYSEKDTLHNANSLLAQPIVYDTIADLSYEQNKFLKSGIVTGSSDLREKLSREGMMFTSRFMHDLDDEPETRGTEDPNQRIKSTGVKRGKENVIKLQNNKAYENMSLTDYKTDLDIMSFISSRVPAYWARQSEKTLIDYFIGVFASNQAGNFAGESNYADYEPNDLTFNAADRLGGGYAEGKTNLCAETIIEARSMKLDNTMAFGAIVMHSNVYWKLLAQQAITTIPTAANALLDGFERYQGMRVVVDNNLPFDSATGVYESWLFGNSSIAFEQAPYGVAPTFEIARDPFAGNGSALNTLFARRVLCVQPIGHSWVNPDADNPEQSVIRNSKSFARSIEDPRKIPYLRLITREEDTSPIPK